MSLAHRWIARAWVVVVAVTAGLDAHAARIDDHLELRDPVVVGGLAVYLVVDTAAVPGMAANGAKLLAEALADRTLTITEVEDGGSVPTLTAVNKGAVPVLAMAGEVVNGGKQDRILAQDVLVPPGGAPTSIAVNCVEQSRWSAGNRGESFGYAGKSEAGLAKTVQMDRNQGATWSKVDELNAAKGQAPSTHTYTASLGVEDPRVVRALAALAPVHDPRAVGVVVAVKGDLDAAEMYGYPSIFERAREGLLRSFVVDAAGRGALDSPSPAPSAEAAASWVVAARTAQAEVLAAQPESVYLEIEAADTSAYELRTSDGKKLKQTIYKK